MAGTRASRTEPADLVHGDRGQSPLRSVELTPLPEGPGDPLRVLYLGGWGRSGTTLLDRMLGQIPGFFSLGEVREVWQSGCTENRPCGCGAPFLACPFWTAVGQEAFGGWARLDLDDVLRLWRSFDRPWALPLLMAPSLDRLVHSELHRYLAILSRLYDAIRTVSGATVVIDSSKLASHGLMVRMLPSVDLRLLHLVRDSRGVAYSWTKVVRDRATSDAPLYMEHYGAASAAARWLLYNEATWLMQGVGVPYRLLRYEDVVDDPRTGVRRAVRHAGLDPGSIDLSFVDRDHVDLEPNHTVDGNPMRFAGGRVGIRRDEEWRRKMPPFDRRTVTALTIPWLFAYGYSLRSLAPGGSTGEEGERP